MTLQFTLPGCVAVNGRTYTIPLVDLTASSTLPSIPLAAIFQIRQRDTLDFSINYMAWLAANGAATIATSTWVVAALSPKIPIIVASALDPAGVAVVVVTPAVAAVVGDTYWLDNTMTTTIASLDCVPGIVVPARVLVRRIALMVVAG